MTSVNAYVNHPVQLYPDLTFQLLDKEPELDDEGNAIVSKEAPFSQRVDTGIFQMADGSSVAADKYGKLTFKPVGRSSVDVGFDPSMGSWRLPVIVSSSDANAASTGGVALSVNEAEGTLEARLGERVFSVKAEGCDTEGCEFTVDTRLQKPRGADSQWVTLSHSSAGAFDLIDHKVAAAAPQLPVQAPRLANLYGLLSFDLW